MGGQVWFRTQSLALDLLLRPTAVQLAAMDNFSWTTYPSKRFQNCHHLLSRLILLPQQKISGGVSTSFGVQIAQGGPVYLSKQFFFHIAQELYEGFNTRSLRRHIASTYAAHALAEAVRMKQEGREPYNLAWQLCSVPHDGVLRGLLLKGLAPHMERICRAMQEKASGLMGILILQRSFKCLTARNLLLQFWESVALMAVCYFHSCLSLVSP